MGMIGRRISERVGRFALLGIFAFGAYDAGAAVRCQLHLGQGCNGPMVYGMQLCARVTFNQGHCEDLCRGVAPLCKVSDFDGWVKAYEDKGRRGTHGELAESSAADQFDQNGQLLKTAGNLYTVCMSTAGAIGAYSSEFPVRTMSQPCPTAHVASNDNCSSGTTFNGDPTNPQCITKDSYCGGGGSAGSYVSTMSAGFQLVDIQNSHFLAVGEQDVNLQAGAATAGTELPGLSAATGATTGIRIDGFAGTGNSSGMRKASAATGAIGAAGSAPTAGSNSDSSKGAATAGEDSAFASKTFGMESSGYGKGGAGHGAGDPAGSAGGGASWFGSGAASAGGSSGEVGFDGAANRGLASAGNLNVDDPENYFLMSDVSVSLFKRVTTVCRKKERSLVLAP